jgi:chromosome segregation ATPase
MSDSKKTPPQVPKAQGGALSIFQEIQEGKSTIRPARPPKIPPRSDRELRASALDEREQRLADREAELREREQELAWRETALERPEQELDRRVFAEVRTRLNEYRKQQNAQQDAMAQLQQEIHDRFVALQAQEVQFHELFAELDVIIGDGNSDGIRERFEEVLAKARAYDDLQEQLGAIQRILGVRFSRFPEVLALLQEQQRKIGVLQTLLLSRGVDPGILIKKDAHPVTEEFPTLGQTDSVVTTLYRDPTAPRLEGGAEDSTPISGSTKILGQMTVVAPGVTSHDH